MRRRKVENSAVFEEVHGIREEQENKKVIVFVDDEDDKEEERCGEFGSRDLDMV